MINNVSKHLYKYLKYHKYDVLIVFLALTSVSISLLVLGTIIRNLIDKGLNIKELHEINRTILLIGALILIFIFSSFFRSYFINNVTEKIINTIRLETYHQLLKLSISDFEELKIGDIISKLSTDLELVGKLITNFLSFFIRNSIMLIGALSCMFIESFKLSIIVITIIPILLLPIIKLGKFVRRLSKSNLENQSDITSNLIETFTHIHTLHAYNQEINKLHDFKILTNKYLSVTSKRLKIRSLFFALSLGIILFSITFIIWIGSIDIIRGEMSSGQMISFIYYSLIAGSSAGGIAEIFTELNSPLMAATRVFALMNLFKTNKYEKNDEHFLTSVTTPITIEFKNLNFSYQSRLHTKALNNISLKIKPSEFIGIIGKSASGKSTLLQLLLKFYLPSSGTITINNSDINNLNTKFLRSLIAYVPQEAAIFSGTIKSNIIFSNPNATTEEIINVATITGVINFANMLDNKLDSEVGERGIRLSGGQKQRIAIVRARLFKPEILLLDEATSALDVESEYALLEGVKKMMADKIIISIAHRISSLEGTDRIFILNNGTIIEMENKSELNKYAEYINEK